jgi:hypothetical protein
VNLLRKPGNKPNASMHVQNWLHKYYYSEIEGHPSGAKAPVLCDPYGMAEAMLLQKSIYAQPVLTIKFL